MKYLQAFGIGVELGAHAILRAIDLRLRDGEMLGVIGPNGAGKSTLLRALAGIQPASGRILLDDHELAALEAEQRARRIAWLAQNGPVHWPLSVARIVALGRLAWRESAAATETATRETLRRVGLLELAERRHDHLSGGERARVLLARALNGDPELLLADEPTAALDLAHQLEVMNLLRAHCRTGHAAIVVLHDLRLASHYCDRLLLLKNGRALVDGTPQQVITAHWLEQAYDIRLRDGIDAREAFRLEWMAKRRRDDE